MDGFAWAAALLPGPLRQAAEALDRSERAVCEELRLRRGREATALLAGREYGLGTYPVTERDLRAVLEAATGASFHASAQQLRRGFLSAPGGVRVGVCGTAVWAEKGMESLREISSLALRVPRAVPGCADGIWTALTAGGFASTLIVSPPGGGKTTRLRESVRRLSRQGVRVAVADERGEIADAWSGEPAFDVGPCTDVLTGAPKAQGLEFLLRAMNPQVLAADELGGQADMEAALWAARSGVHVLATAHGQRGLDISGPCRELLEAGVFRRRVWIEARQGVRRYSVEDLA